jgi:hypothetical protein
VLAVAAVKRLCAHARLDDSPAALAYATSEASHGDESWEQWISEYRRGDALIIRVELTLELADGKVVRAATASCGVFVENDVHAPIVERQVAELARGGFEPLADELAARGQIIDADELAGMYVHVELDQGLLSHLTRLVR